MHFPDESEKKRNWHFGLNLNFIFKVNFIQSFFGASILINTNHVFLLIFER